MFLSQETFIAGIQKTLANAEALIADADLLANNNRKERSYALYQLAVEEAGKAVEMMLFLIFHDLHETEKLKQLLRDIKDHKFKTTKSASMDYFVLLLAKDHISDKMGFLKATYEEMKNVNRSNNLKNESLYVGLKGKDFKSPNELVTQEDLNRIQFRATTRLSAAKGFTTFHLENIDKLKEFIKITPKPTDEEVMASVLKELSE